MSYTPDMPIEKDWKLFRKKLPDWQENFMDRLNQEYAAILAQKGKNPSDLFWELEGRIKQDKRMTGVVISENSRSNMYMHLCELLREGAISLDDLSDFSEELQEQFRWLMKPKNR